MCSRPSATCAAPTPKNECQAAKYQSSTTKELLPKKQCQSNHPRFPCAVVSTHLLKPPKR
eukprot:366505-Chlamydomonas_euryale.AAC.6